MHRMQKGPVALHPANPAPSSVGSMARQSPLSPHYTGLLLLGFHQTLTHRSTAPSCNCARFLSSISVVIVTFANPEVSM